MALADSVKAQTIRNLWFTKVAQRVLAANNVVAEIRAAITSNSLSGEFTAGELTAMQAVETDLASLAALTGITSAESENRPNHRTEQDTVGLEV